MISKKSMHIRIWYDEPVDDQDLKGVKFYVLEGPCKKCGKGDHSMVFVDFINNAKDKSQSIFRTRCLCCDHQDMYLARDIVLLSGDGDKFPEAPPSGEPA